MKIHNNQQMMKSRMNHAICWCWLDSTFSKLGRWFPAAAAVRGVGLLLLHLLLAPAADQSELSIAARLHQSQLTWCRAGPCPRTGAAPPRATATAGCSPATPGHSPRPRQPRTRCHAALATRNILCQMLWCNFETQREIIHPFCIRPRPRCPGRGSPAWPP